ncbi:anchored repeat-type ABC transporter permease subunit [Actinotignum sp. GS-2025c]|uniref:anchored repeat-type ABC transporter permease subunit n=1 Tax=Actinotignum sp. GS-2025c TaxID=3427276 RepID=UPI003F44D5DF
MSFFDFLADLSNPVLGFLPRALLVAMLSAVVCGAVGVHVVLRGMSFLGDALAHAVFPGIVIAFALQGSILVGGAVAGGVVALLIALASQNRNLREDSIIGIFMAAAFAFGVALIARIPGYTGSLESFLFGSLTGVDSSDVLTSAVVAATVLLFLAVLHPALLSVSVDRDFARATGTRVLLVDVCLYLTVALAVVISVQSIGNILVLALLVTPAATARLLTDRVGTMMLLAPLLGCASAFVGVWLSWAADIPAGAAIVLVTTALFALVWLSVPVRGKLVRARTARVSDRV